MSRLTDKMDDVRSVAAETILPVASHVVRVCSDKLPEILGILWDTLMELDDLTASTNSVMSLLAQFYSLPGTAEASRVMLEKKVLQGSESPIVTLIPRLWPFLQHNIASVRSATLETLHKLFNIPDLSPDPSWIICIAPQGLRHLFQAILMEERSEIVRIALDFWRIFLAQIGEYYTAKIAEQIMPIWMHLISTPCGQPLNREYLLESFYSSSLEEDNDSTPFKGTKRKKLLPKSEPESKRPRSGTTPNAPSSSSQVYSTTMMRDNGCEAIGFLFSKIPVEMIPKSYALLSEYLSSIGASYRLVASLVLDDIMCNTYSPPDLVLAPTLESKLLLSLNENVKFIELNPFIAEMKKEYCTLTTSMIAFGAPASAFDIVECHRNNPIYRRPIGTICERNGSNCPCTLVPTPSQAEFSHPLFDE
jgi:TATA-binding protein-associated factor